MNYVTIEPPPDLARYVRYFWVLEGIVHPGSTYVHRTMADGCAELLFHYRGIFDEIRPGDKKERSVSSGLAGQSRTFSRFSISENFGIFGVYLYPHAVPALFPVSSAGISNRLVDLKTLLAAEENGLEEKMMLASDNFIRVGLITHFLKNRLLRTTRQLPAGIPETISYIIQRKGMINIEDLASRNFLSSRQFERNFKELTGFSPKLYSRIIRFQSVLEQYHLKGKSMTDIAYEAGYYDQSHFIRDFKEFSGHNPGEYFSGSSEASAWKD